MRTPAVLLSATLLIGTLAGPATATESVSVAPVAPVSVPSPTVTGPVPATARPGDPSHNASSRDLPLYTRNLDDFVGLDDMLVAIEV